MIPDRHDDAFDLLSHICIDLIRRWRSHEKTSEQWCSFQEICLDHPVHSKHIVRSLDSGEFQFPLATFITCSARSDPLPILTFFLFIEIIRRIHLIDLSVLSETQPSLLPPRWDVIHNLFRERQFVVAWSLRIRKNVERSPSQDHLPSEDWRQLVCSGSSRVRLGRR